MIQIQQLPLGPLQTNCYILACEETQRAVVIDPAWDGHRIAQIVAAKGWRLDGIWLTHSHFDHIGGLEALKGATGAPIHIHAAAVEMLDNGAKIAGMWGVQIPQPPPADEMLTEGQTLTVGNQNCQVLYTPGHAPGHVSFWLADHQVLFDGDVLFQQGIGRTDLPGGDYQLLISSIREKLLVLPDETQVLPGHGPATTIGDERRLNPFLQD